MAVASTSTLALAMNVDLKAALAAPERLLHLARALEFAELEIRRYIWRGQKSPVAQGKAVNADGRTAEDFVNIALKRMVDGVRQYKPEFDLFQNLKTTIRSLVWSHKKASDRTPLVDQPGGSEIDPMLFVSDPDAPSAHEVLIGEEREAMVQGWFAKLKDSLKDKPDLLTVAEALHEEITDCSQIAILCDCDVDKVYELKRSLKKHTIKLFGAQTIAELERKTMETK